MATHALPERTIALEGELDIASVRDLNAQLSEAVGDTTHEVVIDLRHVTFLDSTALGAFAQAARRLRRQGRSLHLIVAPGPVEALLDHSGLRDTFAVRGA